MTRYTPLYIQPGVYPASQDRQMLGSIWPGPASSGMACSNAGLVITIQPGVAAIPTANASGTTLGISDAAEQVTLAAAPGSNSRIDLVCVQARGNDLDGGANNDLIFTSVTGTAAASPVAPATPAGYTTLYQATVTSAGAVTLTDVRPWALNPHLNGGTSTAPTAATVPLTLRGAVGQSADLFDIKNNAGTKLAWHDLNGALNLVGASGAAEVSTFITGDTNPRFYISTQGNLAWGPGNAAADTYLVRNGLGALALQGAASTTNAVLYLIGGSAGGSQLYWSMNGVATWLQYQLTGDTNFYIRDMTNSRMHLQFFPASTSAGANTLVYSKLGVDSATTLGSALTATEIALTIKAAAGQSADLLDIIDSTATKRLWFDSTWTLNGRNTNSDFVLAGPGSVILNAQSQQVLRLAYGAAWSDSANSTMLQMSGSTGNALFTAASGTTPARVGFLATGMTIYDGGYGSIPPPLTNTLVNIVSNTAAKAPLSLSAAASQTGDLFQIRDSTGTRHLWYDANWTLNGNHPTSAALELKAQNGMNLSDAGGTYIMGALNYGSWSDTVTGAQIRSNPIIQFVASNAGPLSRFGVVANGIVFYDGYNSNYASITPPPATSLVNIVATYPTKVPLIIKGAPSQTGDSLQVQSNSGTILSRFDSAGSLWLGSYRLVTYNGTFGNGVLLDAGSGYAAGAATFYVPSLAPMTVAVNGPVNTTATVSAGAYSANTNPIFQSSPGTGFTGAHFRGLVPNTSTVEFQVLAGGSMALGGAGSFGGGTGPMLFLANDTADPSANPTGGTIVFSSAGVLKARTPDGTVTQIAPAIGASVTAPLTLTSTATSMVPLTLVGAASQSNDLLDIKSSSGTVLAAVASDGSLYAPSVGGFNGNDRVYFPAGNYVSIPQYLIVGSSGTGNIGQFTLLPTTAGATAMAIKLQPSATGDVFTAYNSAGSAMMGINSTGQIYLGSTQSFGGGTGAMMFIGNDTADPGSNPFGGVILFSSAGVLKARTPSGAIVQLAPAVASGVSFPLTNAAATATTVQYQTQVTGDSQYRFSIDAAGNHFWGPGNAATDLTIFRAGTNLLAIGAGTPGTNQSQFDIGDAGFGTNTVTLSPHGYATMTAYGLSMNGVAGQTRLNATTQVNINVNNGLTNLTATSGGTQMQLPLGLNTASVAGTWLNINYKQVSDVGLAIVGIASQTGDYFRITNSSATKVAYVDSGGALRLTAATATSIPFFINLAASQTGDAMRVLNSTPTVIAKIDATGGIWSTPSAGSSVAFAAQPGSTYPYWQLTANGGMSFGNGSTNPVVDTTVGRGAVAGGIVIGAPAAAQILVLQQAASPTQDSFQVKASGGTVLSGINSAGTFYMVGANGVIPLQTNVTGDTYQRFYVQNNGLVSWGPGNAQVDVGIQRYGASSIGVQPIGAGTGAFYVLNSALYVGNAGDTYVRWNLAAGGQSIAWSNGTTAPDLQIARQAVGILRISNPLAGGAAGTSDLSTQFAPNASSGGVGDNTLTLFRGTTLAEYLRFGAAAGGGLLAGANNVYYIDRISPSAPSARAIQFRRSMDGGTTYLTDFQLDGSGNVTSGGPLSISPPSGNVAQLTLSPTGAYGGILWSVPGAGQWLFYQNPSDTQFYFRDQTNARMHMVLLPGTSNTNAATSLYSNLVVNGYTTLNNYSGIGVGPTAGTWLTIQAVAVADVPLTLKGTSGQTANLMNVQGNTGMPLFAVSSQGVPYSVQGAAGNSSFSTYVSGDNYARFNVTTGGAIGWGAGSSAQDVTLSRPGANILQVINSGGAVQFNVVNGQAALLLYPVSGQSSAITFNRDTDQVALWQFYRLPSDANLYFRDMVNAKMQMTFLPGPTDALATTQFNSQIWGSTQLAVGGTPSTPPSYAGGTGPMLWLGKDIADPTGYPTTGTILYTNASAQLVAATSDGNTTVLAPTFYNYIYNTTLTAPTVVSSPYTVTHNLNTLNVMVELWDATTLLNVQAQVRITDVNHIQVSVSANAPNNINVVVFGVPNAPAPINPGDFANKTYVDARTPNLPAPVSSGTTIQSFTDVLGDVWIAKNGVASGAWKRARDALYTRVFRNSALPVTTTATNYLFDGTSRDAYGCYNVANANVYTCPVAGVYQYEASVCVTFTAASQFMALAIPPLRTNLYSVGAFNQYGHIHHTQYQNAGDTINLNINTSVNLNAIVGGSDTWMCITYLGTG